MPARAREEREAGGDIIISVVVRGVRACRAQAEDTLVLVHRSSHAREKVARGERTAGWDTMSFGGGFGATPGSSRTSLIKSFTPLT